MTGALGATGSGDAVIAGTLGTTGGGGVDGGAAAGMVGCRTGDMGIVMGADRIGANEMEDADGSFGAAMLLLLGGGTGEGAT